MSTHCCSHDHHHDHHHEHGEHGARVVFWLTMATMAVEILSGWAFGSMALLADGWHMASHAGAMAVASARARLTPWLDSLRPWA